jgi:NitT/TauT family transport system permease protein
VTTVEDRSGVDLEKGLDALELGPAEPFVPRWRKVLDSALPPLVALGSILGAWQLVELTADPDNLPGPAQVWESLAEQWGDGSMQDAILTSLERGVLGFLLSVVIATPVGLLLARVDLLRRAFQPLITGLQSLPSVAWVPAAILWFQLTETTMYFVILMGAIPSVINGTISGLQQVPTLYARVGHVLGARGLTLARHVLLPAALPGYIGGLKQGWAFSWRSLMAAELIAKSTALGSGLGQVLEFNRGISEFEGVLATILVILAVGLAVDLLFFAPLERRVLRRRGLLAAR